MTGKCIRIHATGGPEVLSLEPLDIAEPGPGRVRIRIRASGLNFIDTYHRTGLYPVPLPFIPGAECAGEIEAIGEGVDGWSVGDRVGYLGPGGYASHVIAPAGRLIALPDAVGFETAAATLLKGLTAWMLAFEVRRAMPGDTALVWAPVGGVGSLLVPWLASLGVRVIGVTSTPEKAERARQLGAADVILRSGDVAGEVRRLTQGEGVDVSYDSVGHSSAEASLHSLKPRGWFVSYGNASGPVAPFLPARLAQLGSLVMTRPSLGHFTADPAALSRGAQALFGAMRVGTLAGDAPLPFALERAADAHRALESGTTVGPLVLLP